MNNAEKEELGWKEKLDWIDRAGVEAAWTAASKSVGWG